MLNRSEWVQFVGVVVLTILVMVVLFGLGGCASGGYAESVQVWRGPGDNSVSFRQWASSTPF